VEGVDQLISNQNQLSDSIVSERLNTYEEPETTKELYEFGKLLLDESLDSGYRLDSKAFMSAGYASVILTLLVASAAFWSSKGVGALFMFVGAGIATFVAAVAAFAALKLQAVDWFSPNEWFNTECLGDTERLRRYHILCMYGVRQSQKRICWSKIRRIHCAQWALMATGAFLFLAFLDIAWSAPALKWLGIACW
jgi:hypothetical protein